MNTAFGQLCSSSKIPEDHPRHLPSYVGWDAKYSEPNKSTNQQATEIVNSVINDICDSCDNLRLFSLIPCQNAMWPRRDREMLVE